MALLDTATARPLTLFADDDDNDLLTQSQTGPSRFDGHVDVR